MLKIRAKRKNLLYGAETAPAGYLSCPLPSFTRLFETGEIQSIPCRRAFTLLIREPRRILRYFLREEYRGEPILLIIKAGDVRECGFEEHLEGVAAIRRGTGEDSERVHIVDFYMKRNLMLICRRYWTVEGNCFE